MFYIFRRIAMSEKVGTPAASGELPVSEETVKTFTENTINCRLIFEDI